MKTVCLAAQLLLATLAVIPARAAPETPRPHLHLSKTLCPGATTVEEFRKALREDALLAGRWKVFLVQVEIH